MRGRKPKPLSQQVAEGDPRKIGQNLLAEKAAKVLKGDRGLPEPPSHLTGLAREQWFIWKLELEKMQKDFSADAVLLEGACVNYARAIEADEILKDGCDVEEPIFDRMTGDKIGTRLKNHPAVARSHACWKHVHMFCSELGLSPVSRERLRIEGGDTGEDDLLAKLLKPREPRPKQSVN
jgi:P27 family predicted phage terminase small subunit